MKLFCSYNFNDEEFVLRVVYHLHRQPDFDSYCYSERKRAAPWPSVVSENLVNSECFILFVGEKLGLVQQQEAKKAIEMHEKNKDFTLVCIALGKTALGSEINSLGIFNNYDPIRVESNNEASAIECARKITEMLGSRWVSEDGLPIGYPFDYEKDIIEAYRKVNENDAHKEWRNKLLSGVPEHWPELEKIDVGDCYENDIPEEIIGKKRNADHKIVVDARTNINCNESDQLTFLEAGPREELCLPKKDGPLLKVGILVSGGIAPGINAVIAGIVERHCTYANEIKARDHSIRITGFRNGFAGIGQFDSKNLAIRNGHTWSPDPELKKNSGLGGSIIGTSRVEELLPTEDVAKRNNKIKQIVNAIIVNKLNILYVIGGDGSMKAAHAIRTEIKRKFQQREIESEIVIATIPKTMDNDILWAWQSFGFMSAVDKAKEFAIHLHTETKSNPRLCVMQLFGSDSGFVVSHTALASNICDIALIPEVDFDIEVIYNILYEILKQRRDEDPYAIIIMGETAIPQKAHDYLDYEEVALSKKEKEAVEAFLAKDKSGTNRRVYGQTPDELRSASLKIVSGVLKKRIKQNMGRNDAYWNNYRVFTNEPRHIIRAVNPTPLDEIFAHRLGILAVDNAMAGYTDFMVSQWLTEYVLVPLPLVVLGRKRVYEDGIFWKSVVSATGQPAKLTDE